MLFVTRKFISNLEIKDYDWGRLFNNKMKVILAAAGYGTRMGELARTKPKSLLEVGGIPVIEHCISRVVEIGEIDKIFVISNNKFFQSFLDWKKKFHCRIDIEIINDGTNSNEKRLGTMGDIDYVLRERNVNDDFLVINADNVFLLDLKSAYEDFIDKKKTIVGIINAENLEEAKKKGNPKLDDNLRVINFKEKDPNTTSTLSTIGIYFFPKTIRETIREYLALGNSPDKSGDFIAWLYKKEEVYGHYFGDSKGKLFDIGSPNSYKEANDFFGRF